MSIARIMMQAAAGAAGGGPVPIEDAFSTDLYTGGSSSQTITNGIDLAGQGGMVWFKSRTTTQDHGLFDTNRGQDPYIGTNLTNPEFNFSNGLVYNSNGFTLKQGGFFGSGGDGSGANYVAWTFRKAPRFFDVVTYTGTGTEGGVSRPHNLGVRPGMIVTKRVDSTSNWWVQHRLVTTGGFYGSSADTGGNPSYIRLNSDSAAQVWRGPFPEDVHAAANQDTFSLTSAGSSVVSDANISGATYVTYLFAHDPLGPSGDGSDGLIACESFSHNGTSSTINLGWQPQWLLLKPYDQQNQWYIVDIPRGWVSSSFRFLAANTNGTENLQTRTNGIHPTSTGFQIGSWFGAQSFIYVAIRAEGV